VFREPLAGLEPQLAHIEAAIESLAAQPDASWSDEQLEALVSEAQSARTRIREAAYQQLHRDPYRADMAAGILARVPPHLDALNEEVVTGACSRLGMRVERLRDARVFAIELGNEALVDSLPGVPGGSSFVGSFDREEAVEDETIDFFASGHPLVEGVFAYYDDSPLGRVAQIELGLSGPKLRPGITTNQPSEGLVAIYKDGPDFTVVALDSGGERRDDWAAAFRQRPLPIRGLREPPASPDAWAAMIRRLGARLDPSRRPYALAAVAVRRISLL
jgi:ATP-dependent helicase HepA